MSLENRGKTTQLVISGMSCMSCVARVEKSLASVPGVTSASVSLANGQADVSWTREVNDADLIRAVSEAGGYKAEVIINKAEQVDRHRQEQELEYVQLQRNLLVAVILTVPVFILEMGAHLIPAFGQIVHEVIGHQNSWILQFILTTLVMAGPGQRFFRVGVPALLWLKPDMNSLVVLGTSAAWLYSVIATFLPQLLPSGSVNVYFEAAAVIITLILLGRMLEARARGRTSDAISRLLDMQVPVASVIRAEGITVVPVAEIQPGDIVQVRPGERIALDGELVSGSSFVDESMISGEPVPVKKLQGDQVIGGTLNKQGEFRFRVMRTGEETVLSQIIAMVEKAQASKLPVQGLVDRITLWFVPFVMFCALLSFISWLILGPSPALSMALVNAVSVLIVACPCAMGLATPVSIMVATGRAAEMGILLRNGEALQQLRDASTLAFDKTGTLTEGKLSVTEIRCFQPWDETKALQLLASVESRSEHPVAQAITDRARQASLPLSEITEFEALSGRGVRARVEGHLLEAGTQRLMAELGVPLSGLEEALTGWNTAAGTTVFLAVDGRLAAVIAVADSIKPEAAEAIRALKEMGIRTVMISGDNRQTAEAVATALGIDACYAEQLPDQKVQTLHSLKSGKGLLVFVGDGINDAPALAEADVGIAMGTGTDVAIESADLVIMRGDLRAVVQAVSLAQRTMRNIMQNLFWAFAYNIALIPLAAGLLYPALGILLSPVYAAAAMALSSVFVLTNALRLKR